MAPDIPKIDPDRISPCGAVWNFCDECCAVFSWAIVFFDPKEPADPIYRQFS
jgi:hypothetical protein